MSKEEQQSDEVHVSPEREDRFRWNSVDDVVWLDSQGKPIKQLELGQAEPGKEEDEEKTQESADEGNDDTIETEGGIAPERLDRFSWGDDDRLLFFDRYGHPVQFDAEKPAQSGLGDGADGTEENLEDEEEDDGPICQGPFWPSPDDPDTGYCTCCEQAYYGDLLNHSCLSDDDGEMEDDDEDAEERPVLKM